MNLIVSSLRPKDRRALFVGALFCGSVLLLGRGLPWVGRTTTELATRGERAALVIERAARLREEPTVENWRGLSTLRPKADLAFEGSTPTAAAAVASAYVSDLVRLLGGTQLSASLEADTAFTAGVARMAVHAQLTIDGIGLRSLVAQLERGPKLLRIRSLSIAQSTPVGSTGEPESLSVDVTIDAIGTEHVEASR